VDYRLNGNPGRWTGVDRDPSRLGALQHFVDMDGGRCGGVGKKKERRKRRGKSSRPTHMR
jgi:hypothetical protein